MLITSCSLSKMGLIFRLKMSLTVIFQFYIVSYQKCITGNIEHSTYSLSLKDCQSFELPFWNFTESTIARCLLQCHGIYSCVSVSLNLLTSECLGHQSCFKRCDGNANMAGWRHYCKGGLYNLWWLWLAFLYKPSLNSIIRQIPNWFVNPFLFTECARFAESYRYLKFLWRFTL